jgi:hypothetical protein
VKAKLKATEVRYRPTWYEGWSNWESVLDHPIVLRDGGKITVFVDMRETR